MGERLLCKQEVVGSIPSASTSFLVSSVDDRPPDCEDRWKEPQHGNVDQSERAALALVPRSTRAEAGSWTSEDEVQVTEDAPRPAQTHKVEVGWEQHRTAETAGPVDRFASRLVPARGASVFVGVEIKRLKGIWWMPWH